MTTPSIPPQFVVSPACQFAVDNLGLKRKTCSTLPNVNSCLCDALDAESTLAYCNFDYNKRERWSGDYTQAVADRLLACTNSNRTVVPPTYLLVLPDGMVNPLGTNAAFSKYYKNGSCDTGNAYAYTLRASKNCINKLGECQAFGRKFSNDSISELCVKDDFDFSNQFITDFAGRDYVLFQSFETDAKCTGSVSSYSALILDQVQNVNLNIDGWKIGNQLSRVANDASQVTLKAYDGSAIRNLPVNACVTNGQGSWIMMLSKSSAPFSDVGGPCQQAIPNAPVCKSGLTCIPPAQALPGAAGTCVPVSDVGGPCQQAILNAAVCKTGLVCIPPAVALPGAPGSCQVPTTVTATTSASAIPTFVPTSTLFLTPVFDGYYTESSCGAKNAYAFGTTTVKYGCSASYWNGTCLANKPIDSPVTYQTRVCIAPGFDFAAEAAKRLVPTVGANYVLFQQFVNTDCSGAADKNFGIVFNQSLVNVYFDIPSFGGERKITNGGNGNVAMTTATGIALFEVGKCLNLNGFVFKFTLPQGAQISSTSTLTSTTSASVSTTSTTTTASSSPVTTTGTTTRNLVVGSASTFTVYGAAAFFASLFI